MSVPRSTGVLVALLLLLPGSGVAQAPAGASGPDRIDAAGEVPDLSLLADRDESALAPVVERYVEDLSALGRRWDMDWSPDRRRRLRTINEEWRDRLETLDFDALGLEAKVDWVLLHNEILYRLETLDREAGQVDEMAPLLPFVPDLVELHESRRRLEDIDPRAVADLVATLPERIDEARTSVEATLGTDSAPSPVVGFRAVGALSGIRRDVDAWYRYFAGYDPMFTWWVEAPYQALDEALDDYVRFLREEVAGIRPDQEDPIVGDPIGADGLRSDLVHEMIPYTPAELIDIAEREFAWLEERMLEASRDLGYGDDWKAALEHVKELAVEPGRQPAMVRALAREAAAYVKDHDLVTVPPLAEEIWRMEMMSPERQRVAPFFLGGETILVSYPTDEMAHDEKLMSMRGNNPHFSRATVHHELIPGHHLQGFMTDRYNTHRNLFRTPFWGEGWALYWEMLLWDMGFAATPEDRIGMLFWRMHRAARIIFSLSFHLERMTPEEAIDFLVDRVGHERANAEAEVRRSFNGTYPPLYQAGYMLGGMQIRALHRELVESGRMTDRAFHDAILMGGRMPIEMVRARLLGEAPARDFEASWRFADGG